MNAATIGRRALLRCFLTVLGCLPLLAGALASAQTGASGEPASELVPLVAKQVPASFNRSARVVGTVAKWLDGSGDTLLYVMLDDFEKPIYVKARQGLGRPERHRKYDVTGMVLRDVSDTRILGGYYIMAETQTLWASAKDNSPKEPVTGGGPKKKSTGKDTEGTEDGDSGLPDWAVPAAAGVLVVGGLLAFILGKGKKSKAPRIDAKDAGKRSLTEAVASVTGLGDPSAGGLTVAGPGPSRMPSAEAPRAGTVLDPPHSAPRTATQMQWGSLVDQKTGHANPLLGDRISIGREHQDIPIPSDDTSVSGSHGVLTFAEGSAHYQDQSKNGSTVNGERVHGKRVPLSDGATIQVGKTLWALSLMAGSPTLKPPRADTVQLDVSAAMPARAQTESLSAVAPHAAKTPRAPTQVVLPSALAGAKTPRATTEMMERVEATHSFAGSGTAEFHRAQLEVVDGPDQPKTVPIFGSEVTIGRAAEQVFRLEHSTVSREHATVCCRDGRFYLVNASSQGTLMGGHPIEGEVEIRSGDEFQIGANRVRLVALG